MGRHNLDKSPYAAGMPAVQFARFRSLSPSRIFTVGGVVRIDAIPKTGGRPRTATAATSSASRSTPIRGGERPHTSTSHTQQQRPSTAIPTRTTQGGGGDYIHHRTDDMIGVYSSRVPSSSVVSPSNSSSVTPPPSRPPPPHTFNDTPPLEQRIRTPQSTRRRVTLSPERERERDLYDTTEHRLLQLHLDVIRAGYQRDFETIISLRCEMMCLQRILGGRKSPQSILSQLQLADAYLRASMSEQALNHVGLILQRLHDLKYSQGTFEAYMILGRAYHMRAVELRKEEKESGANVGLPTSSSASSSSNSDFNKYLDKSIKYFRLAMELTQLPPSDFFLHTRIRDDSHMSSITIHKYLESCLGLAHVLGLRETTPSSFEQQQDVLSQGWERLEEYLQREARRKEKKKQEEEDATNNRSANHRTNNNHKKDVDDVNPYDINQNLLSMELYLTLGKVFWNSGDDTNAIDNLKRCVGIGDLHRDVTFAAGMRELPRQKRQEDDATDANGDGDDADDGGRLVFPRPETLQWPLVRVFLDATLLLAKSYGRSEQHQLAIGMYEKCKLLYTQLRVLNKGLNAFYGQSSRPYGLNLLNVDIASLNHTLLEDVWSQLLKHEWSFQENQSQVYQFQEIEKETNKNLLFIEKELALHHVALGQYDQAAVHQEEVCLLLESGSDGNDTNLNGDESSQPSSSSSSSTSFSSGVTGLYQTCVARAHKRLGDIYVASEQPRSARASYQLARTILETMFLKKIHSIHVKHPTHSGFKGGEVIDHHRRKSGRPSSPTRKRLTTGFGTTLPYGFIQISESNLKPEERFIPTPILKLLHELKEHLKRLEKEIKNAETPLPLPTTTTTTSTTTTVEEKTTHKSNVYTPSFYATNQLSAEEEYGSFAHGEDDEPQPANHEDDPATYFTSDAQYDAHQERNTGDDDEGDEYGEDGFEEADGDGDGDGDASASANVEQTDTINTNQTESDNPLPLDAPPSDPLVPNTSRPHIRNSSSSTTTSVRTSKRYVSFLQSADALRETNVIPSNPHLGGGRPLAPHIHDHLVGDSSVFSESLLLRTIGSTKDESHRLRTSAYDAFEAEKLIILGDETDLPRQEKASRQIRPNSAIRTTVTKPSASTTPTTFEGEPSTLHQPNSNTNLVNEEEEHRTDTNGIESEEIQVGTYTNE